MRAAVATGRKTRDPKLIANAALALGTRYVLGDTSRDLLSMIDEAMAALPEHEHELQTGLDHPADGHQFDGHHTVDEDPLRGDH